MPLRTKSVGLAVSVLALGLGGAGAARASFHWMQIEQVVGGVCGDPSLQAVQLRMRFANQNLVAQSSIRYHDETGGGTTDLINLSSNVSNSAAGSRVLVATAAFTSAFGITPDATITTPIPSSLLDAGRLTFESDGGLIYWSLSWGGASYTGSTTGATDNDADGNFGPSFADPLPSSTSQALLFGGAASALSTTNAADYALTSGAATFTNNMGASVTINCIVFEDGFESGDTTSWSSVVP
jgi:hypothetical protein